MNSAFTKLFAVPCFLFTEQRPAWRPNGPVHGHNNYTSALGLTTVNTVNRRMSTGGLSRQRSQSSVGKKSAGKSSSSGARHFPPPTTLTPENADAPFEPCAATASFLLYSQRNRILVLSHDTLAIEKRFDLHREDVLWIAVDNTSERGSGRLAVSYDAGNTAIVWDILTGAEIARFSAYEHIKVASFMRNGNIAFGKLKSSRTSCCHN